MRRALVAVVMSASLLTGCDSGKPPPGGPAAASGRPPGTTSPGTSPNAAAEERTVVAAGDTLSMTPGPLVRSGDSVVLTIPTRLDRAAAGQGSSVVSRHFSGTQTTRFDAVRLVDERAARVYLVAESSDGTCVCTGSLRLGTGETRPLQAAFAGVPASADRLSVMLPYAGVFADVPIVDGPVPSPTGGVDAFGRKQEPLKLGNATSKAADLGARTEQLGVGLRSLRTPGRVDLDLDTDVLFRLDSAQLTPAATRAVGAAVADIEAAGAGPLTITGHTDDTGTAAHNKSLSRQRAEAVADALRSALPDARWPKTVAAKGETEPAVPNDSAAHRALNRRVTVGFEAGDRAAAPGPAASAPLPKTKGVRGSAGEGVEVTLPLHRGTVRFSAERATVRGMFLQVDLLARNVGEDPATILDYLGQGVFTVRDEFDPFAPYGAAGVRLLTGGTASYGLDYELEPGRHRCLCDRLLNQAIPPGSPRVIALWFPAPPAGTRTVTIDVPDKFRLADVPVT